MIRTAVNTIDEVRVSLEQVAATMYELAESLVSMEAGIDDNFEAVAAEIADLPTIRTNISTLQSQMTTAQGQITTLQNSMNTVAHKLEPFTSMTLAPNNYTTASAAAHNANANKINEIINALKSTP